MKNPLIPTYKEREHAPDKFEMEHNADLQMMTPDFDERLRAREEKHDPLNEFTGDSPSLTMSASGHATTTASADLTVGPPGGNVTFAGYAPTAVVAPVFVDETKNVTIALAGVAATAEAGIVERGKKAWITEQELQALIELSKPKPPPDPVPLFEGIASALDWWPSKTVRLVALKGLADEAVDLQPLIAQGRSALVIWRQVCTWGWVLRVLAESVVVPICALIDKVPAWLWAFIVWLKPW